MKKIFSIVALATLLCASAFAQEDGNRDAQGNIVRGPYVTNSFFDNTFIELQGGIHLTGAPKMGQGVGFKSIKVSPAVGLNVGKWFNPNFGLRLGWQGLKSAYYPGSTKQLESWFLNYTHADFLVNVSNWWSGYKESRIWDVIPYVHVGWINTHPEMYAKAYNMAGAGAGLYNRFRISSRVNLSLDLRATATSNRIMGATYLAGLPERNTFGQKLGGVASALVGLNINLGKTGWVRENPTDKGLAAAAGAGAGAALLAGYIGAAKADKDFQALQAKADQAYADANARYAAAAAAYEKASEKVDADGYVTPAAYGDIDPELAAAYADMANFEDCPDFTTMSKAERAAWDKSHKDILPEGWNKMTNEQKNEWIRATVYDPAQVAVDEKEAAARELADARAAVVAASNVCNSAVAGAQTFIDDAAKRIDANGNILPACYPNVDAATAQKYADIANTEAFPDFTTMSKKEIRQWNKAHKDILPKGWNKLTAEQKNDWLIENIYGPAAQAKADDAAAKEELERALARKANMDQLVETANKNLDKATVSNGVGYFTIGKSVFNEKQLANWKKSLKALDKAADYEVVGYADKETGSAAINARLRKERSAYVAELLKENGFTGVITATPASEKEKFVNYPIWKNRSAVIK